MEKIRKLPISWNISRLFIREPMMRPIATRYLNDFIAVSTFGET